MIFSKRSNGYFIELNSHTAWVARAVEANDGTLVEEVRSCDSDSSSAISQLVEDIQSGKRGQRGYMRAACGIYPQSRVVRHATLDPKRFKDSAYINEVLANQVRVEPDKYTLALLDAASGRDFDFSSAARKDALFAGLLTDEVLAFQNQLLASGVYPERLELGSIASLGALVDYHAFMQVKTPTLVLEVDRDATQSYIISANGIEASRTIPQGLEAMVPVVQKEIGLKDEEAARKLFYSNAFDFTGMGATLIKKLLKELQSSIGFYEVQTGQSIAQVYCTLLPPKLGWLQGAISTQLGVAAMSIDFGPWLKSRGISFGAGVNKELINNQSLGLFSLMLSHNNVAHTQKEA